MTTLKNQIMNIAKRRQTKGVTVSELTATIQSNFVNNDGSEVPASSIRARTYELANADELFRSYSLRNGATVFHVA